MTYLEIAQAIQDSSFGAALHESRIAFPVVEGIHLIGLAASFGILIFVDLRLLGLLLRDVPVERIVLSLRRWLFAGFAVTFASGALLFWAEAGDMAQNKPFLIKVGLMLAALINAIVFDRRFDRPATATEPLVLSPKVAQLAGGLSLGLWVLVTVAGRLIPYYPKY